jgi:hypothetical protein
MVCPNPARLIPVRPLPETLNLLKGSAAHQQTINGLKELGVTVVFFSHVNTRQPVDTAIGFGNKTIEAYGNVVAYPRHFSKGLTTS